MCLYLCTPLEQFLRRFGAGLFQQQVTTAPPILDLFGNGLGGLLQGLLDVSIDFGAEEGLKDVLALLRIRQEESSELPLGEHDDLTELVAPKSYQPLDGLRHLTP